MSVSRTLASRNESAGILGVLSEGLAAAVPALPAVTGWGGVLVDETEVAGCATVACEG